MSQSTVLITGAAGQLGHALAKKLGPERAIPKARESMDISDVKQIREWLPVLRPDVVVNCAAYTNTDKAETERDRCWRVNTLAVHNLVEVCNELSIPFIHISSGFVFGQDYLRKVPYVEGDTPGPLGHYAQTKCAAEHAILSSTRGCSANSGFLNCGGWWIIRTSALYERPWRPYANFPQLLLSRAAANTRDPIPVVDDVITTYVPHLVDAIVHIIEHVDTFPWGIYHATNEGQTSWHDFARRIGTSCKRRVEVIPTTREEYYGRHGRNPDLIPHYTVLSNDKWGKVSGLTLPHWEEGVELFCRGWNRAN